MKNDKLDTVDATNMLRGGQVTEPAESVKGRWRYRVHTGRMGVVVQFEDETTMTVVTAWRKKGK